MNNEHENEGHGHEKSYKIIVNGREKVVQDETLAFAQVVTLAFENPPSETTIFTVTYRKAHQHPEDGTLVAGQTVIIKNGTTFNVSPTDRS